MNFLGQPRVVIGPAYQAKTIKVCVPKDPVCSDEMNFSAHDMYATDATMVDQGTALAASRLGAGPQGAVPQGAVPQGAVPQGAVPQGAVPVVFPAGASETELLAANS